MCQIVMGSMAGFLACTSDPPGSTGLGSYYFPVNSFPAEGITYIYRNKRDPTAQQETWRYQPLPGGRMLSINYDVNGEELLLQYDRIVHNGVLADSLILLHEDSLQHKQRIAVKVISPNRFPFAPVDSTQEWLTHLDWHQPGDSLHVVLERRRRYMGPVDWRMDGKKVKAVRFKTQDKFETERDGWTTSMWWGEEVYAKDIGLVYYKRVISDQMVLEFELAERK
jgi:hypothetical protein